MLLLYAELWDSDNEADIRIGTDNDGRHKLSITNSVQTLPVQNITEQRTLNGRTSAQVFQRSRF